jgi:hypothetical protein
MNKKNLSYIVILVFLVIIFIIIKTNDKTEKRISFFNVDSVMISAIEIFNTTDTLKLVKTENKWMIDYPVKYPTTQRKITEIFDKVIKAECSNIPVTELESSFAKYNVTDSLGTTVIFYDNKDNVIIDAIIGKSSNYNYSHARERNDSKVYQLNTNISYSINPTLSTWRKKEITELEETDISKITVQFVDREYSIVPTDSLWQFTENDTLFSINDGNTAFRLVLNDSKKMMVSSFIDNEFENYKAKFEEPFMIVQIELFSGDNTILTFAEYEEKKYIIQKNKETEHLYVVYDNLIKHFQKSIEDFSK